MRPNWGSFVALVALACACGKKAAAPSHERVPQGASTTALASAAPVREGPAPATSASAPRSWTGSYVARPVAIEQPTGTKAAALADDAGKLAIGPGTFSLTAQGSRVTGEGKGALGALVVSGVLDGKELRAALVPADANAPQAMTGWLAATLDASGSVGQGTLRVSNGDARLVREAAVAFERAR